MGFLDWLTRMLRLPARRQLVGKSPNDPRTQKSPEELCEAIDRAEARADELARAYAAQLNDRKSFQARLQREQQRAIDEARGKVTRELIDVADEIERALGAAQGDEGPLAKGVRLIHADLQRRLKAIGAKRLQLVGTRFDPNLAEAIEVLPAERPEDDEMVLAELRPAFTLGDQVVRPARVKVGRYCAPSQVASDPAAQGKGAAPREDARAPADQARAGEMPERGEVPAAPAPGDAAAGGQGALPLPGDGQPPVGVAGAPADLAAAAPPDLPAGDASAQGR